MRVSAIVVLLSLAVEAGLPAQSGSLAFTLRPQGGIVVSAAFNGSGPYRVLLDTGANHSSISEDVARTLGAPPIARGVVSSPAGEREYPVVRVDRLALGPISVGATPTVVPARDLALAGAIDGVLGQDVLAGLRYTIDYRHHFVVWEDGMSMSMSFGTEAELPLTFESGLPIIEIRQGDATLRLVADSGAGGLLLFESAGRELPAMRADGGVVRIDSFHGTRVARSVVIDELKIGPSTFHDMPAVLVKSANTPAYRSDGLLPLHIFGRVTFDGPGRRLILG
jgi:predicted aspartyl protease